MAESQNEGPRIPVAVSARHVHLTQATIERLFGAGFQLHSSKPLSQPGQFASDETITVAGPSGRLEQVRVLGPPRHEDQLEISRSDALALGLAPPLRMSGDLRGTPGATLVGPTGSVTLTHGAILAHRHIHLSPDEAARLAVRDGDVVEVAIDSAGRDLVFGDVVVRVAPDYRAELHLDTDEGNAAAIAPGVTARLIQRPARS